MSFGKILYFITCYSVIFDTTLVLLCEWLSSTSAVEMELKKQLLSLVAPRTINQYHAILLIRCNTGMRTPGYPPGMVPVPENPLGMGEGC